MSTPIQEQPYRMHNDIKIVAIEEHPALADIAKSHPHRFQALAAIPTCAPPAPPHRP